VQEIK